MKTKKTKLILFGSVATAAVVAIVIAVPVALLVPAENDKNNPEQELAAFVKKYPDAVDGKEGCYAVKASAFANQTLDNGFQVPVLITPSGPRH